MKRLLLAFAVFSSALHADPFPASTPESLGLRSDSYRAMSERIRQEQWDIRAVVVLRHGKLALEWYAGGVTRDHHHNIFSITKSVVATLAGLAIGHGDLASTRVTLGDVFPLRPGLQQDPVKARVSLEQLLTMRSGFPVSRANQPSGPERKLFDDLHDARDRLEVMLDKLPLQFPPGTAFRYNNIDPALVLAAIEASSGQPAPEFAKQQLFDPMGFENANWTFADATQRVPGGYGLRLRALDLAKLGQLYLQQGRWNERQLLPADWVKRASTNLLGDGYGYFWWIDDATRSFAAKGVRGQRCDVHPDLNLVYVILSDLPPAQVKTITDTLGRDYLLASVASDEPLPANAKAEADLARELAQARSYIPPSRATAPASRLPQD